ncbi:MAG: hypothetical protein ACOH2H_10345 [Cypionkella sp.]
MSSGDIEDVLSSIRRLVSEDLRPASPRPQIVSKIVVEDKLILTPALRVVPRSPVVKPAASVARPPAPQTPAPQTPAPKSAATPLPRLHLSAALEVAPATPDVVSTLAQAVDRQVRDRVVRSADLRPGDREALDRQSRDRQALDWESETGDPEPDMESLDWSSFTFARRSMRETWIARVAAVEQPEAATGQGTEPAAATNATAPAAPASDAFVMAEKAEYGAEALSEDKTKSDDVAYDDVAYDETSHEAADYGEEANYDDIVEYDSTAAMEEDISEWADEAEAEVLADLNQSSAQAAFQKASSSAKPQAEVIPGAVQEEDNIFSEQVLRELVRDLIREQLQGDLGERITRNIRKLVKAEIARAMAVQALE